jgi:ADP-heptose:LPS heptosyltransferase
MHVIDAYAEEAGIRLSDDEKHITLWYNNNMPLRNKIDLFLKEYSQKSFVVIHPTVSWPNRTLGTKWWDELVTILFKNNILPVIVGTYVDAITPSNNILDLRNQLSIQEIAYLIDQSKVFIGFDSGILNVAGTTSTHIIGIFTHVKAEFRMPYRNGILGSNYTVIKTPLDCYGCHHLQPPPVTGFSCERNDVACIKTIDVNAVVDAALKYF